LVNAAPGVRPLLTTIYIATLALISPIGAGIGLGLTETAQELSAQTAVITVLQGLAAGTLIYVVFFEIIEKERNKGTNGLLQVSIMLRNRGRFFSQSSS
jgi:zinc transporter 1/2/3